MKKILKLVLNVLTWSTYIKKILDEIGEEKIKIKTAKNIKAFEEANRDEQKF